MRIDTFRLASAILLVCFVAGCPALTGLFGATAQEQKQLQQLRAMQRTISPLANLELGYIVRATSETIAIGLPTFYGVDLQPYLRNVPWPALPPSKTSVVPIPLSEPERMEIAYLQSEGQRQLLQFTFNNGSALPPQGVASYKVDLRKSLEGVTGTLEVKTTARPVSQAWRPWSTPIGQPATFRHYTFGRRWQATQASAITTSVTLNRGMQFANITAELGPNESGASNQLLPRLSIHGSLPRMEINLRGNIQSTGMALAGELLLTDERSIKHSLEVTSLVTTAKSLKISLQDIEQRLQIDLSLEDGKLSGEAKSTNPDLLRSLATITQTGAQPQVKYLDKAEPEIWR
ncbi:MAG: hypothetical protein HY692_10315 [Cyanobacteria bacterium NC_groundwater_1444_Ag_S-0.65um_54_12]|nr:hypothetical protein [Cyanobacteria bacterium NC_groundwater_1444_Ag_S-0.65um_54_12]